ncbi:TetR/AcrR family transcriptional regulator [Nevskia ramosa]|uniref:TetR/AcrR family transcriptional regulator n=1 Tax=Nevskia ramosa TaxID=64002 RepID=UPI0003B59A55|nr:TetR/AcrR family transcriptional regulator [Nevskia ramosa]
MSAASPVPKKLRRTQAERSDSMRSRLLEATLQSLAEDGYAASTLSSIVRRAGVSRGAQVHHYPNKQALMLDAAEDLLRRTYRQLGELLLSIGDEDDRLTRLVEAAWDQVFSTPLFHAYTELLVASLRDDNLADALRERLKRVQSVFAPAVEHYFEPNPKLGGTSKADLHALFQQLSCFLVGLATQAHLMKDRAQVQAHLALWARQAGLVMKARKGVRLPPPRPEAWPRKS